MITVSFSAYNPETDGQLKYAVIAARYSGRWIFCRHSQRYTWELPGGHREPGEDIAAAARRELYEETGAAEYNLKPVCVYTVSGDAEGSGMLFFAEVNRLEELPPLEIAETALFDHAPESWTYPQIQPLLFQQVQEWLSMQHGADGP